LDNVTAGLGEQLTGTADPRLSFSVNLSLPSVNTIVPFAAAVHGPTVLAVAGTVNVKFAAGLARLVFGMESPVPAFFDLVTASDALMSKVKAEPEIQVMPDCSSTWISEAGIVISAWKPVIFTVVIEAAFAGVLPAMEAARVKVWPEAFTVAMQE